MANARLAKREEAVVAAIAEVDPDAHVLPDELRQVVAARVEAERAAWRRCEPETIATLFFSPSGTPPGAHRIEYRKDPAVRLIWASRRSDEEPWRLTVLVAMQLTTVATSWRTAISNFGFREYELVMAFWTLQADDDGWTVTDFEPMDRGQHYLKDPLPAPPSDGELNDDATISLAVADGAVATSAATLTEVDAPVRRRLLDLSLVDGRYAPDAIAACVREIARAWDAAVEHGEREALERWSTPDAATQLCRPTPNGLRRVRILDVRQVRIEALDTHGELPTVTVVAELEGIRWLANRHGRAQTPIFGSQSRRRSFTEHWTLRFDAHDESPWLLTDVRDPGRR